MPLISIITINYNQAEGLERTIRSVASQTFKDVQYIVIDGGSTDGSMEVIQRHQSSLAVWVSEKDEGVYDAQNKGLRKATGEYILVLNSGDELADIHVLSDVFSKPHTSDIVYGNMIIAYPDGRRETGYMPKQIDKNHMMRDTLWHPVSFVKRSFMERTGYYDTSYRIVADYDWFLRAIFRHQAVLEYTNRVISIFYLGGLSSRPENLEPLSRERRRAQIAVFGEEQVDAWHAAHPVPSRSLVSRILKRFRRG